MTELYIPVGVRAEILRPIKLAGRDHWSMHLWKTTLPQVIDSEQVVFRPSGQVEGLTFQHYAKLGYLGIRLPNKVIMLLKESEVCTEVPENFDELLAEAEDELEDAISELSWSPFQ